MPAIDPQALGAKCLECPLYGQRPVLGDGPERAALCVVGEAPGYYEWQQGKPFVGKTGQLLNAILQEVGADRKDVFCTNTVLCRPGTDHDGKDQPPPQEAIDCCRPRLQRELAGRAAKIVVALGNSAAKGMLRTKNNIGTLVAAAMYAPDFDAVILPTFHPAAVLHGATDLIDPIIDTVSVAHKMATGVLPIPSRDSSIEYTVCRDAASVAKALCEMDRSPTLAIDTETTGLRYLTDKLVMVQVSNGHKTWVLDAGPLMERENAAYLCRQFVDPDKCWVLHNLAFDFQILRHCFGVVPRRAVDTMALALGVTEKAGGVGLKALSRKYLGEPYYEATLDPYKVRGAYQMDRIPYDLLASYGARDARNTARLLPILSEEVKREGTHGLVHDLLIPAQRCFSELEYNGVLVDLDWCESLEARWQPRIDEMRHQIADYAASQKWLGKCVKGVHEPLNPRSPKQLCEFLYDHLGYAYPPDKHGKPQRTSGEDFLKSYPEEPLSPLLRSFREWDRLMSNWVKKIKEDTWPDGRVHPSIRLWGAATGRLSISEPAMQTVPKFGVDPQLAKDIRRLFVAPPGYVIVAVDYSQLEIRVAWHYSRDEALGRACLSGDFHKHTAAGVFEVPLAQVTKPMRQLAKPIMFGTLYGLQEKALCMLLNGSKEAKELGRVFTEAECRRFLDNVFETYPGYRDWNQAIRRQVRETGRVTTTNGRVRRWNYITQKNVMTVMNQAVNFPVQSLASDLCLHSLIRLNEILPANDWGYPLFPVHDAILFYLREDQIDAALPVIRDVMTTPFFETCATFEVEMEMGKNWADVHEVELAQKAA